MSEMVMAILFAAGLAVGEPAGSVACTDEAFAVRLATYEGKLPRCLSRFLDYPPGPGVLGFPRCLFENPFKANPDFWLKDIDFTCVSPWNDRYGCLRAGTAITKRHVIFAKHFPLTSDTRIAFVGEAGDVSHYTVKATKAIGSNDIQIGLLDYELTPDVHPAKILPADFEKWLAKESKWPVVTFTQHEKVYLCELAFCDGLKPGERELFAQGCTDEAWKRYSGKIVTGDSGNPAFMLYRGRPILLYCLYSAGVGHGPRIHKFRSEVQRAMDDLCPGYRLEEFEHQAPITKH